MVGRVPVGTDVPLVEPPEVDPAPRRPKSPLAPAGTPWLVRHWVYLVKADDVAARPAPPAGDVVAGGAVEGGVVVVGLAVDEDDPPQAVTRAESTSSGTIPRSKRPLGRWRDRRVEFTA
jgi:hypothetical protein